MVSAFGLLNDIDWISGKALGQSSTVFSIWTRLNAVARGLSRRFIAFFNIRLALSHAILSCT